MTVRDSDSYCDFSTTIEKKTTPSDFEEIRDYDDQLKYVRMDPFFEFDGSEEICSIQVNRAALDQDGVEIRSLTFLIEFNGEN